MKLWISVVLGIGLAIFYKFYQLHKKKKIEKSLNANLKQVEIEENKDNKN